MYCFYISELCYRLYNDQDEEISTQLQYGLL